MYSISIYVEWFHSEDIWFTTFDDAMVSSKENKYLHYCFVFDSEVFVTIVSGLILATSNLLDSLLLSTNYN